MASGIAFIGYLLFPFFSSCVFVEDPFGLPSFDVYLAIHHPWSMTEGGGDAGTYANHGTYQ